MKTLDSDGFTQKFSQAFEEEIICHKIPSRK